MTTHADPDTIDGLRKVLAKERQRRIDLEDQLLRVGTAVEQTVERLERGEDPPIRLLRGALGTYQNRWDRTSIVEAIQEWNGRYGGPPTGYQWNPRSPDASEEDRERFLSGDWPSISQVKAHFPKWNMAMAAAGFEPRTGPDNRTGGVGNDPEKWPRWTGYLLLPKLRNRQGMTQTALARAAKCSAGAINQMETARAGGNAAMPNPSVRFLLSMARALEVPGALLLDEHLEDDEPAPGLEPDDE